MGYAKTVDTCQCSNQIYLYDEFFGDFKINLTSDTLSANFVARARNAQGWVIKHWLLTHHAIQLYKRRNASQLVRNKLEKTC